MRVYSNGEVLNISDGTMLRPITKSEYDALSEEDKQADVLYVITDYPIYAGNSGASEIYSTEETRIGTWIDGKPLYRKCYHVEANMETGNRKYVLLDEFFTLYNTLVNASGNFNTDWGSTYSIPYIEASGSSILYNCSVGSSREDNNHTLWLTYQTAYSTNADIYVCVEYTKITD